MQVNDRNRSRRTGLVLGIACFVLQLALAPQFSLGNGHVNFCLVLTLCVALSEGGSSGVLAGFLSGLVFDLSTTGPIGLMALIGTVCAYVMGTEVRNRLAEDPESSYLQAAVACLVSCAVQSLFMLALGETASVFDAVLLRALPTAFLTFLFFVPFAWYLSRKGRAGMGLSGSVGRVLGSNDRSGGRSGVSRRIR